MNPQTFLPLASGAGVIIGYILYFYATLTKIEKTLDEIVGKIIEEQLQSTIVNSLSNNKIISKISETATSLPQVTFNASVNLFMRRNNLEMLERRITDEILNGNVEYLVDAISSNFGIKSEIAKGIVGTILDDPLMIYDAVQSFADRKGLEESYIGDLTDL